MKEQKKPSENPTIHGKRSEKENLKKSSKNLG